MSQKIIVFAGPKQSGKNTGGNFVAGYVLTQIAREHQIPGLPTQFSIDKKGQLIVNAAWADDEGNITSGSGVLDLNRTDSDFIAYASRYIWPYVKIYSFAELLKTIAVNAFGLTHQQVNGTNEDKNTLTGIRWKDMCSFLPPRTVKNIKDTGLYDRNMTAREFLQYFGTNICRKLYDSCWVDACFKKIVAEGSELAIITDARFPNEVYTSKAFGAKTVRMQSVNEADSHSSEQELKKVPLSDFDLVLPPKEALPIKEQNQLILDAMYEWEWFNAHIDWELACK